MPRTSLDHRYRAGPGDLVVVYRRPPAVGVGGLALLVGGAVVIALIGTGTVRQASSSPTATVRAPAPVALTRAADPASAVLATLPDGTRVTLVCTAVGPPTDGWNGPSAVWDRVRAADVTGFVPDADLVTSRDVTDVVPAC